MEFKYFPKEKQKYFLDKHRYSCVDYDWWYSEYEYWKEKLEEIGFLDVSIHFSGFWSQGDGACFDCKYIDLYTFVKTHKLKVSRFVMRIIENGRVSAKTEIISHYYSHEKTRKMQFDWFYAEATPKQEAEIKELEKIVEQKRLELCKQIYKSLEETYEHLISDEAVIDFLEINDFFINKQLA